jgi:hypothetical protein
MTDRTPCRCCGKVGFVRQEHMIDRGRSTTLFYCGSCNQRWQVVDIDVATKPEQQTATIEDRRTATSERRRTSRSDRRSK